MLIFTDAATSPQAGVAIGTFFYLNQSHLKNYAECSMDDLLIKLADKIIFKKYISKKSTWAEIKTVIDALYFVEKNSESVRNIEIYTDCQSVCDLLGKRKEKLQKSHFITRTGKILQNAELYKALYAIAAKFKIQIFKVQGHAAVRHRLTAQEKIFAVLDKLSRRRLRSILY